MAAKRGCKLNNYLYNGKYLKIVIQGWRMRFNSNSVKNSPDYVK